MATCWKCGGSKFVLEDWAFSDRARMMADVPTETAISGSGFVTRFKANVVKSLKCEACGERTIDRP